MKTAVTRYPTINYISPLSNDEIQEGKRCLLNHLRRSHEAEAVRQQVIERTASPKKKNQTGTKFNLNLHPAATATDSAAAATSTQEQQPAAPTQEEKEEIKPRQRAAGGVWITANDFPHAFTNLIIYHNLSSFKKTEVISDMWVDQQQPYISNERDIYLKMTIDDETFNSWKTENKLEAGLTLQEALAGKSAEQEAKESWDDDKQLLPGERKK